MRVFISTDFVRIYMNLFKIKQSVRIFFGLYEFCSNCANCANLFGFCILYEFCSDCANCVRIVQIVKKAVLIFAHKKNRIKNKALCSSFVRIFCSF